MLRYLLSLFLILTGIPFAVAENMQPKLNVVASQYPLAYFAERIAGLQADVRLPIPKGIDPAYWRPGPNDIRTLQKADLLLFNGASYETWLPRVSLSHARQIDTSAAFAHQLIRIEQAVTHSHGGSGQHTHEGTAFTTWLDLSQAGQQAQAVADGLSRKQPEMKNRFTEHLKSLQSDLAALDQTLQTLSKQKPDLALMASHPVYQYLARRYGFDLVSVHWEPGEIPTESEWTHLSHLLEKHPARWMIWESQPHPETARRLTRLGITSLVFDPCANRPAEGDFLSVMASNIWNLRQAFAP